MSCFTYQELISGYLDDELSREELKKLLIHLEACSSCKKYLTVLTTQKEKLLNLRSASPGPLPNQYFSKKVIEKISETDQFSKVKQRLLTLPDFINWVLFPIKRPLYAGIFSVLILVGIFTGLLLENMFSQQAPKKLLTVYELENKKSPQGKERFVSSEDEEKSSVFHHVAFSTVGTVVTEPCLLKYTAYTPSSDR